MDGGSLCLAVSERLLNKPSKSSIYPTTLPSIGIKTLVCMNATYRHYTVEQLARDDSFRQWVIERDPVAGAIWTRWVARNPDRADTVALAQAFLLTLGDINTTLNARQLDTITSRAIGTSRPLVRLRWQPWAARVAALLVLVLGVGYAGWFFVTPRAVGSADISLEQISPTLASNALEWENRSDTIQRIVLKDKSTVMLYPNSRLHYPRTFEHRRREVYLHGKAFFSIAKNQKHPFWVYTDKISTQVLGTRFMVNASGQQLQTSVAVTEGRVSVYRLQDVNKARQEGHPAMAGVILTPNQQVSYTGREERFVKSVVENPRMVLPPAPDAFVFEEMIVADVFARLENAYGLTVIFDQKAMENCYVTANLTGESLTDQLTLIARITRSTYELVDGQIIFHGQGCDAN